MYNCSKSSNVGQKRAAETIGRQALTRAIVFGDSKVSYFSLQETIQRTDNNKFILATKLLNSGL